MWKPLPKITTTVIASLLVFGSVACNNDTPEQASSPKASTVVKVKVTPATAKKTAKPAPVQQETPEVDNDTYEKAIDIATGAVTITKSAASRDDWSLAAKRWQEAIQMLKTVPASDPNRSNAQKKIAQYQGFLADAKLRSAAPAKSNIVGDSNPQFFSIPIKGRTNGIPIVEVRFDGSRTFDMLFDTGASQTLVTASMAQALGLKAIGAIPVTIADGTVVLTPVASVKSMEADGRLKRKVEVGIAPPAMPIGLLGQDFFEGYSITIKQDVIEFRRD